MVRDAIDRVREVLPGSVEAFIADRTVREVVTLNLLVAIAGAAAFRNLVAHQYGAPDWRRVYALAGSGLGDLDAFCATLASRALS